MAADFLKKEEIKNLGKYVVTSFGKADDFSHLSNLTFWKFISFYVNKDYPKQESDEDSCLFLLRFLPGFAKSD